MAPRKTSGPDALERHLDRVEFDLTTVRLFIATAELGSITRAAERICLAPAAASRRMKELEAQFGLPLLKRLPHGMRLTDAGLALLGHARGVAHAVARMQDDAQAFREGDKGVVRIAACTSVVLQFLPVDLVRCHAACPGIKIDLQEQNSLGVLTSVNRGVADLGIYESEIGGPSLPGTVYRSDRLVLVVPTSHSLAGRPSIGVRDILPYDVVGLTAGSATSCTLDRVAAATDNGTVRTRIQVSSFASMLAMVGQGLGIGLIPQEVAKTLSGGRRFQFLEIHEEWAVRKFMLCHHSERPPTSAVRAVMSVLKSDCVDCEF